MNAPPVRDWDLDDWLAVVLGLVIAGTFIAALARVPVQQTQYAAIPVALLILALVIREERRNRGNAR